MAQLRHRAVTEEQPLYYLQHTLGFQVHDPCTPPLARFGPGLSMDLSMKSALQVPL